MADTGEVIEDLDERTVTKRAARGLNEPALSSYFGEGEARKIEKLADGALKESPSKPLRVFILPGFMGSKLGRRSRWHFDGWDRIWIDGFDVVTGGLGKLAWDPDDRRIEAVSAFHIAYLKMLLTLRARGFEAHYLPYDWRKSPQRNAATLFPLIGEEAPVALIGHSQGGRVVRALAGMDPGSEIIRRVITLGTPHFGAYSPVRAIAIQFPLLDTVAKFDLTRTPREFSRQILRNMPGLLDMLPVGDLRPSEPYFEHSWWPDQAEVPDVQPLAAARATSGGLAPLDRRAAIVIGTGNDETTVGAAKGGGPFVYTFGDGDGTVPRDLAEVPGIPTWYTTAGHGLMANDDAVIEGVLDLLDGTSTDALATSPQDAAAAGPSVPLDDPDSITKAILRSLDEPGPAQ